MRNTATGRALLAEGEARGEARARRYAVLIALTAPRGAIPAWVAQRLEQEHDLHRLEAILVRAARLDDQAELESLFAS